MYNILISGYYGFNNIGDEAVLRTVVDNLKQNFDDIDITILSHDPPDTSAKHNVHAVPRMSLPGIIQAVRRCDMLISGGGGLLQDTTSRFSILYYLFIIWLASLFRKKIFIYSQGIGPIRGSLNRFLTGRILRKADGICVRDSGSAAFLDRLGVPLNLVHVTADPVIRLHPAELETGHSILSDAGVVQRNGRLLVGWALKAPSDPSLCSSFLNEVRDSILWLKNECGADSVLIPFHYEQDLDLIRTLSVELGDNAFYLMEKHLSSDMLSIIGNLDMLIGVRLHSLIYSSVMNIPCIGISYDPKIDSFLHSIGSEPISDLEHFRLDLFRPAFLKTLAYRKEVTSRTAEHVSELIHSLDTNDTLLREIKDTSGTPASSDSKHGKVVTAIGGVMFVTLIAKILGILRESVQANVFGAADLYYTSYNRTIYLFTTVAYAMSVAAVPIITQQITVNRKEGIRTANNIVTVSLLISIAAATLWVLSTLSPFYTLLYGADSTLPSYIRVMSCSLPIIVVAYIMVAVFQAMGHYALQGSMSIPYSVAMILFLILFGKPDRIYPYVIAVSIGWILQFAMCLPYAKKEHYLYRPTFDLHQPYIRTFLRTIIVTIVSGSMYLFCYLTDTHFTAALSSGTTSAFYYADKLFTPLTTTFIYSISAVIFPTFNRKFAVAGNSETQYKSYVWTILSNILIVVFPICMVLIVFNAEIIQVLFESGNFTHSSTLLTAGIFTMYAIGMAGFCMIDMINKAFLSMNRSAVPLFLSLGIIVLNLILDCIFRISSSMLALSTSISMTAGAVAAFFLFFRGIHPINFIPALKSLASALIAGAAGLLFKPHLLSGEEGKILLIIKCLLIGCLIGIIYLICCFLLRLHLPRQSADSES